MIILSDSGNIFLKNDGIYLYSHWGGGNLMAILRSALIRGKPRWHDRAYLNRIIFSEMIKEEVLEETGYGLSNFICGEDNPTIVVDAENNTVDGMNFENFIR